MYQSEWDSWWIRFWKCEGVTFDIQRSKFVTFRGKNKARSSGSSFIDELI